MIAVQQIEEIRPHIPPNATVFVDVDDTLITPASLAFAFGSPVRTMIDELKAKRDQFPDYEDILSHWRLNRSVRLVEEGWPLYLAELRRRQSVFGLTQMDTGRLGGIPSMEKWRAEELARLGLTFTEEEGQEPQVLVECTVEKPCPGTVYKGIFITGSHTKGAVIQAFFARYRVESLVLIDDRLHHLDDVGAICREAHIPFKGLLYKGVEGIAGTPDLAVAAFQKQQLFEQKQWLEDKAAEALMKKRNDLL